MPMSQIEYIGHVMLANNLFTCKLVREKHSRKKELILENPLYFRL